MIFINGNVPSSKNSKVFTRGNSFMSKTVKKYLKSFGIMSYSTSKKTIKGYKTIQMTFPIKEIKEELKTANKPIILGIHFVRGTKHKFDFNNISQILADLFTAFDIIEDDNMDELIFIPIKYKKEDEKYYSYNKEKPGVYIKNLTDNDSINDYVIDK